MQVLFVSRHPLAAEFRALSEQRIRFALRRLAWRVPRAEVQLSDLNGPKGGLDKRCQIALRTDGAGTVVVASVARHWRTALDQALARAARFLVRQWRRTHEHGRQRQRPQRDER
ncbi:HPF/RaiA family ribosome-associated protein [Roseateles flavus]|uniref:HPF/RaiA family ribosome-associated protein n=1 Tax=Roseateles flavus TaxID=3149041 RepID=A0ABV0GIV5_9BURK